MQLKEFVQGARAQLSALYPSEEANTIAGVLCTEYLGVESYTYMVNPALELKEKAVAMADKALVRLVKGEPLQYVLGYTVFYNNRFNVSPSVLIPRPETELICRIVIEQAMIIYRHRSAFGAQAAPVRILDLCTGSGCIAWTLAANVPGSVVVGIDVSAEALQVARNQKIETGKGREPRFFQADIFDDEAMSLALGNDDVFDIIVSNPPYVLDSERSLMRRNVLDFEPALALFVPDGDAQKFNKKIADICVRRFNTDAVGFVEINEALGRDAEDVFHKAGFRKTEIFKDFSNRQRLVKFSR